MPLRIRWPPRVSGKRAISYEFGHCLHIVLYYWGVYRHFLEEVGFLHEDLPRGESFVGLEISGDEISRWNFTWWSFPEFLFEIHFICLTFLLRLIFHLKMFRGNDTRTIFRPVGIAQEIFLRGKGFFAILHGGLFHGEKFPMRRREVFREHFSSEGDNRHDLRNNQNGGGGIFPQNIRKIKLENNKFIQLKIRSIFKT